MATNPEEFSKFVKHMRRELGRSQAELAGALGVSFATINRWENGKTTPFKLARDQFVAFCDTMIDQRKLKQVNNSE